MEHRARTPPILLGLLVIVMSGVAAAAPAESSLVVDGPRVVIASGVVGGVGHDPVTYNSVEHEFFVVWDDMRNPDEVVVYGQRVAPDGSPIGGHLLLASDENRTLEASVAFNPVTDEYLVT